MLIFDTWYSDGQKIYSSSHLPTVHYAFFFLYVKPCMIPSSWASWYLALFWGFGLTESVCQVPSLTQEQCTELISVAFLSNFTSCVTVIFNSWHDVSSKCTTCFSGFSQLMHKTKVSYSKWAYFKDTTLHSFIKNFFLNMVTGIPEASVPGRRVQRNKLFTIYRRSFHTHG